MKQLLSSVQVSVHSSEIITVSLEKRIERQMDKKTLDHRRLGTVRVDNSTELFFRKGTGPIRDLNSERRTRREGTQCRSGQTKFRRLCKDTICDRNEDTLAVLLRGSYSSADCETNWFQYTVWRLET